MEALYVTVPIAMAIALFFLGVFIKAFKKGQFDDIEAAKYRIFFEDEFPKPEKKPDTK
ncbi:cbb3-type cytochrome oxidase assembly protein CcoS [Leptospira ognonensis]|uniref:Cbb3-type cytochrome oxidase assembly protein CcoS n=1 Tax=Leptospira ognonensis TaxID=2484945 RepID=A0A4R9KAI6_9LEPT|nr:cbb3-type cytochrome oxidase assembly protein CcoS [Leptospira ognonensis]TGL61793.1 cbb3-type cytochrome oxidase assembly protein CcoS [Leptospira ognonensis]